MKGKTSLKTILVIIGCTLTVVLAVLALMPLLNEIVAVEVVQNEVPVVTEKAIPYEPKECLVTAIYEMEENSKKISAIYIEVFHVGSDQVCYFEVPVDTRVNLSEELYKSLQTYAPELPKYLKLSNMAECFSKEYGQEGSNRILSEVLGISVEEYVRADAMALTEWFAVVEKEKTSTGFFADYTAWLENSRSSLNVEERWVYYESWKQVNSFTMEEAPGSRDKDGYLISEKRSRERLQELMISSKTEK